MSTSNDARVRWFDSAAGNRYRIRPGDDGEMIVSRWKGSSYGTWVPCSQVEKELVLKEFRRFDEKVALESPHHNRLGMQT